jgi:DNA-directed RNA polymerase subunit RPC12/RpoP
MLVKIDKDKVIKIICPLCGFSSPARIDKYGRLYWVCGDCSLRIFFIGRSTRMVKDLLKEKLGGVKV